MTRNKCADPSRIHSSRSGAPLVEGLDSNLPREGGRGVVWLSVSLGMCVCARVCVCMCVRVCVFNLLCHDSKSPVMK